MGDDIILCCHDGYIVTMRTGQPPCVLEHYEDAAGEFNPGKEKRDPHPCGIMSFGGAAKMVVRTRVGRA